MRSIGKLNIDKVKKITNDCKARGDTNIESIRDKLPTEMWDTWESANSEIDRIIMDTLMRH